MKRSTILGASLALLLSSCGTAPASSSSQASSAPLPSQSVTSQNQTSATSNQTSSETKPSQSVSSSDQSATISSASKDSSSTSGEKTRKYDRLNTFKIADMPENFIYGMDASAVPALENSGVKYFNEYGEEEDVFKILADNGINTIRVRIWNDPYDANGKGYGGGTCDLNNAIAIGKRATKYNMGLLVDFHYSDYWADPAKQTAPKAWTNYTLDQKKTALYDFTKSSLTALKNEKIVVTMVQVGNETNNLHMAGETNASNTIALMKEGSKAVREVFPDSLVAVHFADPQKGRYPGWAKNLSDGGLDYDVFGSSYYPYWHGTLQNLASTLSSIAKTYNKKVMVLETSYAWTYDDYDSMGNTSPKSSDTTPHDITMQGQYDQIRDVIKTIGKDTTNGIGVCYWEGTWIAVNNGTGSWNQNLTLWDKYGSGWTAQYAKGYDKDVTRTEGCVIENQAFFDKNGIVLPSIEAFKNEGKDEPLPVGYSATKNGDALTITNVKDESDTTNKGKFVISLAAGDKLTISDSGTPLNFYHYDETNKVNVNDGPEYTAKASGEHTIWHNGQGELWVDEPSTSLTWYLAGSGSLWPSGKGWDADKIAMDAGSGTNKAETKGVALSVGDKLKVTDNTAWFGYEALTGDLKSTNFESKDSAKNIGVKVAGTYDIVLDANNNVVITLAA